jgi:hypothetical protein
VGILQVPVAHGRADLSPHPGYWLAGDGNWYPDHTRPSRAPSPTGSAPVNRVAVATLVAGIVTASVVLIPEHARMAMGRPLWSTVSVVISISSLAGTIAGLMALSQIRRTGERGKVPAVVGLIPCLFVLIVEVVVVALYVFGFTLLGGIHP